MKFLRTATFTVLMLLIASTPAAGQENDEFIPYRQVVLLCVDTTQTESTYYDDICTWSPGDDDIIRETTGHDIINLEMSPDGTKLVYQFLPEERGDALTSAAGPVPTNIGIMDLTVPPSDPARFTTIADQTTGLPDDADETTLQRRSMPVWSPDSTQLAWVELDLITTAFSGRIVVYDTTTSATQVVARQVSLGYADAGEWGIPDLVGWNSVIAHTSVNAGVYPQDTEGGGFGTVLDVYDLAGNRTGTAIEYFADLDDQLVTTVGVSHSDEWQLGLNYTQTGWVVFDPIEQTFGQLANPPYIQAVTGVGWQGHILSLERSNPAQIDWRHDEFAADEVTWGIPHTFDPDGNPIWLDGEGQVVRLHEGNIEPVLLPEHDGLRIGAVVWTPYVWLTDGAASDVEPTITR